jgi:aspartyl/asparaginyl beta-hydroxylase (cupin superfamily)
VSFLLQSVPIEISIEISIQTLIQTSIQTLSMQVLQNPSQQSKKLWFVASGQPYDGGDPCFFDPQDFPWVKDLESQWPVIRDELEALLKERGDSLTPYFHPDLVSSEGVWKTFAMYFWGLKFRDKCKQCPQTTRILESIPHMIGASFSMLEPESTIKPHHGDTNAIARCHLGLLIPAQLPECGMGVGDEKQSWEEGKLMMFCDAHKHTAWNHTPYRRFVLIVDVIRPEYASQKFWVCFSVWKDIVKQWFKTRKK